VTALFATMAAATAVSFSSPAETSQLGRFRLLDAAVRGSLGWILKVLAKARPATTGAARTKVDDALWLIVP
jgi:hypothetical protein